MQRATAMSLDSGVGVVSTAVILAIAVATAVGAEPPRTGVKDVVVVFKTHFDIGYTDMARNVVASYRTSMMDRALAVVERSRALPADRQFIWTIAGWPMHKILEDGSDQSADRKRAILQAFKGGRFAVHALPFTLQTEMFDPETLVRGLEFATHATRSAGLPLPRSAKMTDVPGHSWIMPTLLKHAGVEFLHIGCNAASSSPRVPVLFWWEGPDGSRLLTMYSAAGYGTGLEPPPGWPHKTWLALVMSGDNAGPPTPEEVTRLFAQADRTLPGVKVRIGQLSDFADRILAEKPDLPVVRGDMGDTWIHGPMCDPSGVSLARNAAPAMAAAESLATLLRLGNVASPSDAGDLARAYEQNLLYFEHTWGGSLSWVTQYGAPTGTGTAADWSYGSKWSTDHAAGRFKRLEASWEEHSSYARSAHELVTPLLGRELQTLASAVGIEGRRVVVYNPLPWKRHGAVSVRTPSGEAVEFTAHDVPPLGYRGYPIAEARTPVHGSDLSADAASAMVANQYFKIVLDPARGAIRSLVDLQSGRELIDSHAPHAFGQYLHERFDAEQVAEYVRSYVKISSPWAFAELGKPNLPLASQVPYRALTPARCRLDIERSAHAVTAVMRSTPEGGPGYDVVTRVTLEANSPHVDMAVTVDKPTDPWPEAGWLCLPFNVTDPRFRVGRAGSVMDPAHDVIPGGNRHLFAVSSGVAVHNAQGRGAGVCAIDAPLVSLGAPGCWKFSWDYVPKNAAIYINLFNNQWSTNYRLWCGGKWTSRVRIWSFDRYDAETSLVTPSLEARQPLLATMADGPAGFLPPTHEGLGLSRKGVLVTVLGPDPGGRRGTLLRFWECAGVSGKLRVTLPQALKNARTTPVDLRGTPVPLEVKQNAGILEFDLKAYTPASFLLE